MDIRRLEKTLWQAGRTSAQNTRVPDGFAARVCQQIARNQTRTVHPTVHPSALALDHIGNWAHGLWRSAITCTAAVAILMGCLAWHGLRATSVDPESDRSPLSQFAASNGGTTATWSDVLDQVWILELENSREVSW